MTKRKKKKLKKKFRLKTKVKRFLVFFIFFLIMGIYTVKESYAIYQDFQYKKTYEYKIKSIGYNEKETKILLEKLSENNLNIILANEDEEYNEIYFQIVNQKYFLEKNFNEYLEYQKSHKSTSYENIIAIVNVKAHNGWYGVTYNTDTSKDKLMLVNKFYKLDENFERNDIEDIPLTVAYSGQKASKVVIEQYLKMREDIQNELNVHLMVNSSYRPYKDQEEIYNSFKLRGQSYADSYAARPGFSEHQTGLALDITSLEHKNQKDFTLSEEYQWLKENCHKYGFILRYPENKEHITGYNTESWHFRYIGEEIATKVYNEGITFDEYYAFYLDN